MTTNEVLITTRRPENGNDLVPVLDSGWVRLSAVFGDERFIAESARQSTSGATKGEEQDRRLIKRLWKDRHTSPFEMASITFTMKAPLFVVQQILRHRTGKFNQFSFRYSDGVTEGKTVEAGEELDFYAPFSWRSEQKTQLENVQRNAIDAYKDLLAQGVPSELARIVLPAGLYTRLRVQFDLHNLLKFLLLRTKKDVQWETRQYAWAMWDLARPYFPGLAEVSGVGVEEGKC